MHGTLYSSSNEGTPPIRKCLSFIFCLPALHIPHSFLDSTPLTSMHHLSTGAHSLVFDSVEDSRLQRTWSLITGRGLGGTSRINCNVYTCGAPAQYNAWSEQGRKGWSYNEMKPYLLGSQHWVGVSSQEHHGSDGTTFSLLQY